MPRPRWLSSVGIRPRSRSPNEVLAADREVVSDTGKPNAGLPQMDLFETNGDYGLQSLNIPPSRPSVDIYFVHGLTGNRESTWTWKHHDLKTFWPKDLLPQKVPNARISSWGYDADFTTFWKMPGQNRIVNHAKNLVTDLANFRDETNTSDVPIIFVVHSLGGLVLKRALIASCRSLEKHKKNILEWTFAVAFLGTPHCGATKANWVSLANDVTKLFKSVNKPIVNVLQPDSEVLAEIDSDYATIVRERFQERKPEIQLVCFYEEVEIRGIGFIVPKHSAIIGGHESVGIARDHVGMTKFENTKDAGYVRVSAEILRWTTTLESSSVPSATIQTIFSVPFERDEQFFGREDVLSRIGEQLQTKQRISLYGLGGVGKSQIIIEYAYRHRAAHPKSHIFWVYAADEARFDQGYREIGRKLDIPRIEDPNADGCQVVSDWLRDDEDGEWLMILDNADDPNLFLSSAKTSGEVTQTHTKTRPLADYLPKKLTSKQSLLITTRDKKLGESLSHGEPGIEILPFSLHDATALLRSKAGQTSKNWDSQDAEGLVEMLGCIPLALTQAAAFISYSEITLQEFRDGFEEHERDYLTIEHPDHRRERGIPNAVFHTWEMSFDQIRKQKPQVSEIFSLMAMFDRQRVPELLLQQQERYADILAAVGVLLSLSFITKEVGKRVFVMHRLVQLSVQAWLESHSQKVCYEEKALSQLADKFPESENEDRERCEILLPHARAVLRYHLDSEPEQIQRARLLHNLSEFDNDQGRYYQAYADGLEAYNVRDKFLGKDDFQTLHSLEILAVALEFQGNYKEAEAKNRQALAGKEKLLGVDDLRVLGSAYSLARILYRQKEYNEAEEINRRALTGMEEALGPEHCKTLRSASLHALLLVEAGKHKEAEDLFRRTVAAQERVLGREHPNTLATVHNTSTLLRDQGKHKEAEELYRRTLAADEKVLGLEHPRTLITIHNLAFSVQRQGKFEEAEELYRRALAGREKVLGGEHLYTLSTLFSYAFTLHAQERYPLAEELYRRALAGEEKVLGGEHPDTLTTLQNLAFSVQRQGRYGEAEELYRRALAGREKVLGGEHPQTLSTLYSCAFSVQRQGRYEEAEELYQRALAGREKVLGEEHPQTLSTLYSYASIIHMQQKYQEAEELYRRELAGEEKVMGEEHPDTLISVHTLATLFDDQDQYDVASEFYQRAIAGRQKVLGPQHHDTLDWSEHYRQMLDRKKAAEIERTSNSIKDENDGRGEDEGESRNPESKGSSAVEKDEHEEEEREAETEPLSGARPDHCQVLDQTTWMRRRMR